MRQHTFFLFSFIPLLFGSAKECNVMSKAEISYFKDFDRINVEGIDPLPEKPQTFPFVEYSRHANGDIVVKFHVDKKKVFSKKYFRANGILSSTNLWPMHDNGCPGLCERQYYFARDKMISYVYCGKHETK